MRQEKQFDDRRSARPLRRSVVLVPGHRPELLLKALKLPTDVLLLDLQDSVPLQDAAKVTARRQVCELVRAGHHNAIATSIRVNGPRAGWVIDDVRAAVACGADSITVPQAHGLRDVLFVEGLIELLSLEAGLPGPAILLEVETPGVLCELETIGSVSRRVNGLCVAPYDYAVEVEAQVPIFGQSGRAASDAHLAWLRPKVVAVARANGWTATDAVVVSDPKNADQVREAILASRRIGFDGSAVLHPSQLAFVNRGFSPSEEELARARETLSQPAVLRQQLQLARRLVDQQALIEISEARRGSGRPEAQRPDGPVITDKELP